MGGRSGRSRPVASCIRRKQTHVVLPIRRRQDLTESIRSAFSPFMGRFKNSRLARMSSGHYCLIRDLGLVKGGKGLRHHEVLIDFSWRGLLKLALSAGTTVLRRRAPVHIETAE